MTILICMAKDDAPGPSPIPRGTRWCMMCATEIWVSNTMISEVDLGDITPMCMACSEGVAVSEGGHYTIDPRQEAELQRLGILDMSRRLIAKLNEDCTD